MHRPGGHRQGMQMSEVGRDGGGGTAVNCSAWALSKQTRALLNCPLLPHGNVGSEWLELPTFLEILEN